MKSAEHPAVTALIESNFELVSCPGCQHEHVRPAYGRNCLPCYGCGGTRLVVTRLHEAATGRVVDIETRAAA